jgi:sugar phosphate permease
MSKASGWQARHTVLAVLFVIQIISYMDRMVMSVAIPYIATDFHLNSVGMGVVMSAFFLSYSISQIPGGLLADKFGVRRVATIAMLWWSAFTAVTGAATNVTQMLIARFCFGLGEGIYPACSFKTIAVWFSKKERAAATAILLACGALGVALAPILGVKIVALWGWRTVFYSLFIPGVLAALLFWMLVPDKNNHNDLTSPDGVGGIDDDGHTVAELSPKKISFLKLLKEPNLLKCFFILLTFDLAYWGFSSWLPTYLVKARHFTPDQMGVAASLPPLAGAVGCLLGGWASEKLFSKNRKIPIIIAQLVTASMLYLMYTTKSVHTLLIVQTVAGFFLYLFFSAFWALPMNTVPKNVMGSASGVINMAGQIAAFISPLAVGSLIEFSGGEFQFTFIFFIVSILVSFGIVLTLPTKVGQHLEEH